MKWRKLGRVITPQRNLDWMQSHAMVPVADHVKDGVYRIYFSGRNKENQSLVGYAELDISAPFNTCVYAEHSVLGLGELGHFDDNGVTPISIVNSDEGVKYLYYVGWKPRSTTRFALVAGLASSCDKGNSFSRVSRAPILKLTDNEPISILTAPFVLKEDGLWRMWYVSGVKWVHPDLPVYNIKYAISHNGIDWEQTGIVCIENREGESALARPCVLKEDGVYKMWYAYKFQENPYRLGYAESVDGIKWKRLDEQVGIDVSDEGWDSEMIEYAHVFKHDGKKYMLYNGNGYGQNGIGLAVCED